MIQTPVSALRRPLALSLLALALCAGSASAQEAEANYELSKQYGSVLFKVMFQQTLFMVGRFDDYSGTLYLPDGDLSQARLEAMVNMASLNMTDADVSELLVSSSSWFNSSLYPQATFKSTGVEVGSEAENSVAFNGELTFMGQTKPWTLNARFFGGSDGSLEGGSVGMQAVGTFKRSDFGLDEYMNMAADEVEIEVNVKFNES